MQEPVRWSRRYMPVLFALVLTAGSCRSFHPPAPGANASVCARAETPWTGPGLPGSGRSFGHLAHNKGYIGSAASLPGGLSVFTGEFRDRLALPDGSEHVHGAVPAVYVTALNPDGDTRWSHVLPAREVHALESAGDAGVYLVTAAFLGEKDSRGQGFVHRRRSLEIQLLAASGQERWRHQLGPLPSRIKGSLYLSAGAHEKHGLVLSFRHGPAFEVDGEKLGKHGQVLLALGPEGKRKWLHPTPRYRVHALAIADDGQVMILGSTRPNQSVDFGYTRSDQRHVRIPGPPWGRGNQVFLATRGADGGILGARALDVWPEYTTARMAILGDGDLVTVLSARRSWHQKLEVTRLDATGERRWRRCLELERGDATRVDVAELVGGDVLAAVSHKVGHSYRDHGGPVVALRYTASGELVAWQVHRRADSARPGPVVVRHDGTVVVTGKDSDGVEYDRRDHAEGELLWYRFEVAGE